MLISLFQFSAMFYIGSCCVLICFFFFKQKTAYEMRISDWSSDVCSSDLNIEWKPWRFVARKYGSVKTTSISASFFGVILRRPTKRKFTQLHADRKSVV